MTDQEPRPDEGATDATVPPIAPAPPSMGAPPRPPAPSTPRPAPVYGSLMGAAGGLLVLASLFLLLGELGEDQRRLGGIAVSLAFEVVGVLLLVTNRHKRAATSGVVITAIGVIPLVVFLFVDVKDPSRTIDSVSGFTRTATLVLVGAAAIWLVAFLFGPGRRYGFYLGAALIALWLVAVVQIVDQPLGQLATGFTSTSSFTTVTPKTSFDDSGFDRSDSFGSSDQLYPERGSSPDNPSTKLGIASLVFGGAYLALARWRDRAGDGRTATVFFFASIPILTLAVLFLGNALHTAPTALLGLAVSAVAICIAAPRQRRFTSWYATATGVVAISALVNDGFGESNRVMAALFALVGVTLAVLASRLPGSDDDPTSAASPLTAPTGGPLQNPGPDWQTAPFRATDPTSTATPT